MLLPVHNSQPLLGTTSRWPQKAARLELFLKHSGKWMWVTYSKSYNARKKGLLFLGESLGSSLVAEWAQWAEGQKACRKAEMFRVYPILRPCIILHPEGSTLQSGSRGTFLHPEFPHCIVHQFIPYYVTTFAIIPHQLHSTQQRHCTGGSFKQQPGKCLQSVLSGWVVKHSPWHCLWGC